jgi:hypothetical protein
LGIGIEQVMKNIPLYIVQEGMYAEKLPPCRFAQSILYDVYGTGNIDRFVQRIITNEETYGLSISRKIGMFTVSPAKIDIGKELGELKEIGVCQYVYATRGSSEQHVPRGFAGVECPKPVFNEPPSAYLLPKGHGKDRPFFTKLLHRQPINA